MDERRREALLKEYGEVSTNFRTLTEIRFKLLAFLPVASAAAAVLSREKATAGPVELVLSLSLFGLAVTIGLVTYNARNDQLYDELVGRAAAIERSLGLVEGSFAHRPQPWLTLELPWKWKVDHRNGVGTIYAASIALWLYAVLAGALELARRGYVRVGGSAFGVSDLGVHLTALVMAIGITFATAHRIGDQKRNRQRLMRSLAHSAVRRAIDLEREPSKLAADEEFISRCAKLAAYKEDDMRARAQFYATGLDPQSLSYYLPVTSGPVHAAHLVALLTDLPPGWVLDCFTQRRVSLGS